jgi:hypothetical protein
MTDHGSIIAAHFNANGGFWKLLALLRYGQARRAKGEGENKGSQHRRFRAPARPPELVGRHGNASARAAFRPLPRFL